MNDIEIMARTLFGEARARDVEDAEAIASVILNRVGYRNWPNTISEVCLQPWQFSCWNQNDPNRQRVLAADRKTSPWFDQCWTLAERAVSGGLRDRTRTSTHYHTRTVSPKWSRGKIPVYETQGHIFFNNIDTPAPQTAAEALEIERPIQDTRTVRGGLAALIATIVGGVYEFAGEALAAASQAVAPLHAFFDSGAVKWVLVGIAVGGIAHMIYSRIDDRKSGLR